MRDSGIRTGGCVSSNPPVTPSDIAIWFTMAQPPPPSNWGRWGPQQTNPDYMMDDNTGLSSDMMQYDSREATSATLQRQPVNPEYMMSNPYGMTPMTTMNAPQYPPPNPFGFTSYAQAAPASLATPSLRHYQDHLERLSIQEASLENTRGHQHGFQSTDSSKYIGESSRSPSVKSELHTPIQPQRPLDQASPSRSKSPDIINDLMKVIQAKAVPTKSVRSPESCYLSPPPDPKAESDCGSPKSSKPKTGRKEKDKFACDWPDCDMTFGQKTHLRTHLRKHTGAKPYVSDDRSHRLKPRLTVVLDVPNRGMRSFLLSDGQS